MTKKGKQMLTLDQPTTYQIKLPGKLDERWPNWGYERQITIKNNNDSPPTTTLTCTADQAALLSLLRHIYSLGIPLISVVCLDFS